ncbi:MAG: C10 family peptidase [Muribaculaceae bacterium]|nr:C10 family peptidase [Muribaculaceae bacterium]
MNEELNDLSYSTRSADTQPLSTIKGYITHEVNEKIQKQIGVATLNSTTQPGVNLQPLIFDGDTIFYLAQYKDGWDLYSNDLSVEKLPFSSPTGHFNLNDPSMPPALKQMIDDYVEQIKFNHQHPSSIAHRSWGGLSFSQEEISKYDADPLVLDPFPSRPSQYPPGRWVLVEEKETSRTAGSTPKLTSTRWGQESPWNTFCHYVKNKDGNYVLPLAGCSPVAIAQYVYATHKHNGTPYLNEIIPVLDNNNKWKYSVTNQTFPWNKIIDFSGLGNSETTAILIGYIGDKMNIKYGIESSGVYPEDTKACLKSLYKKEFELKNLSSSTFDTAASILKTGLPIVARANAGSDTKATDSYGVGHVFLIDQLIWEESVVDYHWVLEREPLPEGVEDIWIPDMIDIYGNVIAYAYHRTTTWTTTQYHITMNWGWNGYYNNTLCTPFEDWNVNTPPFSKNKQIYLPK